MTNQSHAPAAEPDEALGRGCRPGRKLHDTIHRVRLWIRRINDQRHRCLKS